MTQYKNKKLLILGANVTECFIVKRAQKLGMYVIVTDNNKDIVDSPAKIIADESWNISWSDIDELEKKCIEAEIDGVIAGFSEFRVENQIKLCNRLGIPCPITLDQLEITRDKAKFKNICRQYDIPVVEEYTEKEAMSHLPVIVKPVDRAGSIGIRVAYTKEELNAACKYAKDSSPSGNIVIEKYMQDCIKFDVYYLIQNGTVQLIASNDTLMCPHNPGHEVLQAAWLFPSKYELEFRRKHEECILSFFKGINIQNGYITISAFVDKNCNFSVFETGFRLSGELSFKYTEHAFGNNYIDFMLAYSIGSNIFQEYEKKINENPMLVLNHYANDGKVKEYKGLEIKEDGIETINYLHNRNILKNPLSNGVGKIAMSFIDIKSNASINDYIKKLNNRLDIYDNKKSLIYYRVSTQDVKNLLDI